MYMYISSLYGTSVRKFHWLENVHSLTTQAVQIVKHYYHCTQSYMNKIEIELLILFWARQQAANAQLQICLH